VFELPEVATLAKQINNSLAGKVIRSGSLGNAPHKFVWHNRAHDEFEKLTRGRTIGQAYAKAKWLFIPLEPGYVLLLGECGGKVLYHSPGSKIPKRFHLHIVFEDASFFTATTQIWGAIELYEQGKERDRKYLRGMRTTPTEPEFTFEYFGGLLRDLGLEEKRSAKGLLTQDQIIPGLGNAIAQDILFRARLHPRYPIADLTPDQTRVLYQAIVDTAEEVMEKGGRYDEYDLHDNPGGYTRMLDKNAVGHPCPDCETAIEKIQYLGGACYLCPACQRMN
jgi:formamidopyrimidine-DNA glycosylase